jgi:hypothetical protein
MLSFLYYLEHEEEALPSRKHFRNFVTKAAAVQDMYGNICVDQISGQLSDAE